MKEWGDEILKNVRRVNCRCLYSIIFTLLCHSQFLCKSRHGAPVISRTQREIFRSYSA